nr:tyrosine-protein phosphatase [uncultured Caproiciproducens sp.]
MLMRRIPLKKAKNMRDLGGYWTQSGKITQFGRLIRSDAPVLLSDDEIQYLIDFGVSAVVDMRSDDEVMKKPCSLNRAKKICYFHCPMAVGNRSPKSQSEVPNLYWEMITDYSAMNRILSFIARQRGAVIFHCTAGKDRTGVVAAVLLLLAGVPRSDILADYQVSYTYIREDIRALLAREPDRPAFTGRSDPEYMEELLNRFENVYGTVYRYLQEINLPNDEIQRLQSKLIGE